MNETSQHFYFKRINGETCVMDFYNIKKAAIVLRSINNPKRQRILALLATGLHNTVTGLMTELGLEQSLVSQQLATLKRAEMVVTRRSGKNIFYSLNTDHIAIICQCIEQINSGTASNNNQ